MVGMKATWVAALMTVVQLGSAQVAGSHQQAELVVCAEASNLPFSNQREEGFENRLAALLAEELGLQLDYRWMDFGTTLHRHALLERGDCDLMMGVSEGQQGYLTTISYYVSNHVFVYREDAPFEIATLDDPVLRDLRIGVQVPAGGSAGPPLEALATRKLIPNAVHFPPDTDSEQPLANIVEAVVSEVVDVAIAWGPVAGYFAAQQLVDLTIVPVQPMIDPPFQPLSFSIAIGARPGDVALIERLNLALANRWEEVQALLAEAHVPLLPLPPPSTTIGQGATAPNAAKGPHDNLLRIGLVVPKLTGNSTILGTYYTDLLGDAARSGALLAEGEFRLGTGGSLPKVLLASSPNAEVAARAARRLVSDGVEILIGGVGLGQAEALAEVAHEAGALFLNVSTPPIGGALCAATTFHLVPSAAMNLRALFSWFSQDDKDRWYVVYEDSAEGRALATMAAELVAGRRQASGVGQGAGTPVIVGQSGVEPRALNYLQVLRDIAETAPDVVMLLIRPEDQTDFLAQQQVSGPPVAVAAYPHAEGQTRERLANTLTRSQTENLRYRIQYWEPTLGLEDPAPAGAASLNVRFVSRWGRPMDPTAWSAYQAVVIAETVASQLGDDFSVAAAIELLADDTTELGLTKPTLGAESATLTFRPSDHQLLQPLYVVEIDPQGSWSNKVSEQLALAAPVAVVGGAEQVGQESSEAAAAGRCR